MSTNRKSETCCGEPGNVKQTTSVCEPACCAPSQEPTAIRDSSACCDPQVESPRKGDSRAASSRLNIDFMYLDLAVCERCQDTESVLGEAIKEISRVLETTGVEVTLNKIHVTSEEQASTLGFLVSPTIRVNGRDIQLNFRESLCDTCGTLCDCEGGVSCREWEYQEQWYDAPPKGLIVESILREVYGGVGAERVESGKLEQTPENLKRFFSTLSKQ